MRGGAIAKVFVVHRPGLHDALVDYDWSQYGTDSDVVIAAPGFRSEDFAGWMDRDWPHEMRLSNDDFYDKRSRMFVHSFKSRLRPTLFTLPRLSDAMVEELGTITDYLLTYDDATSRYGLRVREIREQDQPFWFMAKLARG
ncbi:MAG: hypothetical protein DI537_41125 [Stutzerimonas stutzeri]|nr:MAG: hypothetical protein DI537_41125 [Stutzerimonas stutzeri]